MFCRFLFLLFFCGVFGELSAPSWVPPPLWKAPGAILPLLGTSGRLAISRRMSAMTGPTVSVPCHGPDEINSRGNATVLREYYDGEEREKAGRRVDA
ncbi:hypothetical protein B0J13DRAFT_314674 [Dactylonectria estremocensis]|uniref:Secreted protein n=1 Tax=Dactylonectria estremocensis TaxID=1079267 RepID=A0A9P9CXN9_9HYPO|nr:hypothetical protein B0J13DRAFT_314674 [Dactylonectria estremocensis]